MVLPADYDPPIGAYQRRPHQPADSNTERTA